MRAKAPEPKTYYDIEDIFGFDNFKTFWGGGGGLSWVWVWNEPGYIFFPSENFLFLRKSIGLSLNVVDPRRVAQPECDKHDRTFQQFLLQLRRWQWKTPKVLCKEKKIKYIFFLNYFRKNIN